MPESRLHEAKAEATEAAFGFLPMSGIQYVIGYKSDFHAISVLCIYFRLLALYSTDEGSRQGLLVHV